jgi:hypothetical protein
MSRKITQVVDFPHLRRSVFLKRVFSSMIMRLTLAAGSPQNARGRHIRQPLTVTR